MIFNDTTNVTNMSGMFRNTTNVTNMSRMFRNATNLNKPLLWDTSTVTDMSFMFKNTEIYETLQHYGLENFVNIPLTHEIYNSLRRESFVKVIEDDKLKIENHQIFGIDGLLRKIIDYI
jgi:hypothetical protein